MRINLPVIEIIQKYKNGQSETALAKEYGVERRTIHRRLLSNNVDIRSAGEQSKLRKNADFNSNDRLNQTVDGIMLGDGWIEKSDRQDNARLAIEINRHYEGWLNQISRLFSECDVKHSIRYRAPRKKKICGIDTISKESAIFRTSLYDNFAKQRERWYPKGKKVVPSDFVLTPLSLAHWYWGDGSTNKYQIKIYTNNFSDGECLFLIDQISFLLQVDFKIGYSIKGHPTLNLFANCDRTKFLNAIRHFAPGCFKYKVVKPVIIRKTLSTKDKRQAYELRKDKLTWRKIAEKLKVSETAVRNAYLNIEGESL